MKKVVEPKRPSRTAISVSGPGDVRVGPVLAIPDVLSDLGVSPQRAFALAGFDPRLFDDPDNRVSLDALGNLVQTCVALTNCTHFGLLVGERFELKGFGPLGYLMKNSATVGDALRSLLLHLHLHDAGGSAAAAGARCLLRHSRLLRSTAMARGGWTRSWTQSWRFACASWWSCAARPGAPCASSFHTASRAAPCALRRVFRSSVSFEAEVSGVVFDASWLDAARSRALTPRCMTCLAQAIRDAQAHGAVSFAEQVERVLPQMVLSGMASARRSRAFSASTNARCDGAWRPKARACSSSSMRPVSSWRSSFWSTRRFPCRRSPPPCGTTIRMCSPGPSGAGLVSARRSGVPGSEPGHRWRWSAKPSAAGKRFQTRNLNISPCSQRPPVISCY